MRLILFLCAFFLFCSFAPADVVPVELTLPFILSIIVGCYEVISRLIPTSKGWSIIGKILEVLTWVSNLFDRKKK